MFLKIRRREYRLIQNNQLKINKGFWLHIDNLDKIASVYNEIRSAIIEQKENVQIQSYTSKVNPQFALFTSFVNRVFFTEKKQEYIQFSQIPLSLLDQFRVINYVQMDLMFICQSYLTLIGIKDSLQFNNQFIYFMTTLCENFFVNLGKDYGSQQKHHQLYQLLISQSSYIQIFQTCLEFQRQKLEVDDFIHPIDAFKASLLQYFKNLLNPNQQIIFNQVFDCFFPLHQKSLAAVQIIDNPINTDFFREYFQINKLELHEEFIVRANGLINLVNQKKNIIISGKSGYGKSTLVKIAAFVHSSQIQNIQKNRMNERDYLVNMIPVSYLETEFLLGSFNSQKEFKEGLLKRIYDTVNIVADNLIDERKSILLSNEDVCSYFSKKKIIDNHTNKLVTLSKKPKYIKQGDWFVFDCGSSQQQKKIRLSELLLDSIDEKLLQLPNGLSQKLCAENQNIFLFENISNISPRILSNYSIFILHKEIFSVRDEFNSWINKKCHQQPKIQNYVPYIKCGFEYLLSRCLDWVEDNKQAKDIFLFSTSKKLSFLNFLNIFEILLNEIRKREISLGLFEYSELSVRERKMTPDPILLRKVSHIENELKQYQKFTNSRYNDINCQRREV